MRISSRNFLADVSHLDLFKEYSNRCIQYSIFNIQPLANKKNTASYKLDEKMAQSLVNVAHIVGRAPLRPFRTAAESTALAVITMFRESGSTPSFQYISFITGLLLITLKEGATKGFLRVVVTRHI
jgi:hypothetical protein